MGDLELSVLLWKWYISNHQMHDWICLRGESAWFSMLDVGNYVACYLLEMLLHYYNCSATYIKFCSVSYIWYNICWSWWDATRCGSVHWPAFSSYCHLPRWVERSSDNIFASDIVFQLQLWIINLIFVNVLNFWIFCFYCFVCSLQ